MLHRFLTDNREAILTRARSRVRERSAPRPTDAELALAIPLFLDELIETLGGADRSENLHRDATRHGGHRQELGFTVAQVVHDYGDICQAVTQLLVERDVPINTVEFGTLNLVLDNAIAHAVTEHTRSREHSISLEESQRLGFLAHELRDHLHTASVAFDVLKTGTVAIGGSTGAVLERSLSALHGLINRSLTQVRLDAGIEHREQIEISTFLEQVEAAGVVVAKHRGMSLSVERGEAGVLIDGDRQLLGSAVSNLLHNAFKYSRPGGHVRLRASATGTRV
jgi:signal transduction histidine kinase